MKEILNVIHNTIYQYFDACEDDEEVPMSDKDKLLLEVNNAICNNLKALDQQKVGKWIITKEYNGYETIIKDCKCQFCNEKALLKKSYSMDGQSIVLYPSNYCPSCGAKLEV